MRFAEKRWSSKYEGFGSVLEKLYTQGCKNLSRHPLVMSGTAMESSDLTFFKNISS